jgi:hypothetical protein
MSFSTLDLILVKFQYFFREMYKKDLQFPKLPLVHVGNKNKTVYWPMELVSLKSQACPITKGLTGQQTAEIIK